MKTEKQPHATAMERDMGPPAIDCETRLKLFVPWTDSALLCEESVYALVNKAAWFSVETLMSYLLVHRKSSSKAFETRRGMDLSRTEWTTHLDGDSLTPIVHGRPLRDAIVHLGSLMASEVPVSWLHARLRICPACIGIGVHLRLHQHRAILRCPVHGCPLQTRCSKCSGPLSAKPRIGTVPFSCARCGSGLTRSFRVETAHPRAFREIVAASSHRFLGWQEKTNLAAHFQCGIDGSSNPHSEPLNFLTCRRVIVLAASRIADPPQYVIDPIHAAPLIRMQRLDLEAPLGSAATEVTAPSRGGDTAKFPNPSEASEMDKKACSWRTWPGDMILEYRTALRRVTTVFLTRVRKRHARCLEIPYKLFRESLDFTDPDLLGCCPVAIGFWIWRLSSGNQHRMATIGDLRVRGGRPCNLDLLWYAISRSYLHYCIHTACACIEEVRRGREPGAAIITLDSLLSRPDGAWGPTACALQDVKGRIDFDGAVYYLSFDLCDRLEKISCKGCPSHVKSMLDPLKEDSLASLLPASFDIEATWKYGVRNATSPFALMSDPVIFSRADRALAVDGTLHPMGRLRARERVAAGSKAAVAAWRVLDSAINARAADASLVVTGLKKRISPEAYFRRRADNSAMRPS